MKVILLNDVKGKGKKDDVIDVSVGYANNYLIKNKLAVKYTNTSNNILNKEIDKRNEEEKKREEKYNKIKKELEKEVLEFEIKSGNNGRFFGSISKSNIKDELKKRGFDIKTQDVIINNAIASAGIFNVEINLYKKINAKIKVKVQESK